MSEETPATPAAPVGEPPPVRTQGIKAPPPEPEPELVAPAVEVLPPLVDEDDWGVEGDSEPVYWTNGRIRLTVDGITYRLRRPKLGELEELRELSFDSQDALAEIAKNAAEAGIIPEPGVELAEREKKNLQERVENWMALNKFNRQHQASGRSQVAAFFARAVELLDVNKGKLPGGFNDWPLWLGEPALIGRWIQHWTYSDPAAPGSNGSVSPGATASPDGPITV